MVTKEEVMEALRGVVDPELEMDIVTLGMVRSVAIDHGSVSVVIALTSESCPLVGRIKGEAESALEKLQGVSSVVVETAVMNDEERSAIIEKLKERRKTLPMPGKLPKQGIKRILAILSGKGGVGKSSVTSMLAVEMQRRGLKVGILDADITGPSIPKIFGVSEVPFVLEGKIIPATSSKGIKIISMNLLIGKEETPVVWRGPLVSSAIRQFYTDVDWGELDYLLVDLPPGTSDAQLTVLQLLPVDGIVVVTSPQELAGVIVAKAVQMSRMLSVPIVGVLENMSYVKCPRCGEVIRLFGESRGRQMAEQINAPFLGSLPIDPDLSASCDRGKIEEYRNGAFEEVASKLLS
ncbi:MAG: Mrp/NBP35 family ATP-binding protein [Candidatus Verstraetearchaeota archaeon]|nr:Mrp/NBP35 family ATP-binding protein [Candidatus Verstraetearchaeota archaeon]